MAKGYLSVALTILVIVPRNSDVCEYPGSNRAKRRNY